MKNLKWILITFSFILGACDPTSIVPTGDSTAIVDTPGSYSPNSNTVCDPFSNQTQRLGSDLFHGVVAQLKYLDASVLASPDFSSHQNVSYFQDRGTSVNATLFMDEINVPTRMFSLGFTTLSGDLIKDQNGKTLYENFTVHFESQIQLTESQNPGPYQFALLADDGAVLTMDLGAGDQVIVNNDGVHPSKFVNSKAPVYLSSTPVPLKLDYFQGPKYHIAMMLLWRPWPSSGSSDDSMNGQSGNSLFFNPNVVPSAPTSTFKGLLSRGWRPVPAASLILPSAVANNPCQVSSTIKTSIDGASPSESLTRSTHMSFTFSSTAANATFTCSLDGEVATACTSPKSYSGLADGIHHFQVYSAANGTVDALGASYSWTVDTVLPIITSYAVTATSSSFTVQWATDKPTSSRMSWDSVSSPLGQFLPEDPTLVTDHSMTVYGLQPFVFYYFNFGGTDAAGNVTGGWDANGVPLDAGVHRIRTTSQ